VARDDRRAHAGFHRFAHRLVARQHEEDAQVIDRQPLPARQILQASAGTGAAFADHPAKGSQIDSARGIGRGRPATAGDHQHHLIVVEVCARQHRMLRRSFDQTEAHLALGDGVLDLAGVANHHIEPYARVYDMEGSEPARQPIGRNRLTGGQRNRSGRAAGQILQHRTRHGGAVEHRARFTQEYPARPGELNSAAHPVEQLDLIELLQRGDGRRGGRLAHVQRLGCARDMPAFGDLDEDAQLLECHESSFYHIRISYLID
jgi:hypothetical protein